MKRIEIVSGLLVLVMMTGCNRPTQDIADARCVLVDVDGVAHTRGDLNSFLDMRLDVERVINPGFKKSQEGPFKRKQVPIAFASWTDGEMLRAEAKRRNLNVTDVECDKAMAFIVDALDKAKRRNPALAQKIDAAWLKRFRPVIRAELLAKKAEEAMIEKAIEPTAEEVDLRFKELDEYNRIAALTNQLVYARATNVWEQLNKGADFVALVKKYGEAYDFNEGTWGTFGYIDLKRDSDTLANAVAALKVGEYTAPVEGGGGLMILKLLDVATAANGGVNRVEGAPEVFKNQQYKLRRIYFRLPQFYTCPSREHMVNVLRGMKRNESLKTAMEALRAKATVTYPCGTNVVARLMAEFVPDMPRELFDGGGQKVKSLAKPDAVRPK